MKKGVIIFGATSAIARASANSLAKRGYPIFLAGRNEKELERLSSDISIRYGVNTYYECFDAEKFDLHKSFIDQAINKMNGIDGALLAFGDLGEQKQSAEDFNLTHQVIDRNFTGACSVLTHLANTMEKQKSGFIVGISSVASDRGRQSNYIYGAAKGGMSVFLQGLRNRLYPSGVHVMTVKPGFVDTSMTFGLPNMFLVANPNDVGEKIVVGIEKNKNVLYVPWFWSIIMKVIKFIPETLFKRLKL